MLEARVTGRIGAPATKVWVLAGDFDALPRWIPGIVASRVEGEGIGQVRHLTIVRRGRQFAVERLETRDDAAFRLSYSIVESSLPVTEYTSFFRLIPGPDDKTCILDWSANFLAKAATNDEAIAFVTGAYSAGLASLQKTFGA
ncbi:MAG: SRPBCC family protein [Alphaproteobacteria bacterium]